MLFDGASAGTGHTDGCLGARWILAKVDGDGRRCVLKVLDWSTRLSLPPLALRRESGCAWGERCVPEEADEDIVPGIEGRCIGTWWSVPSNSFAADLSSGHERVRSSEAWSRAGNLYLQPESAHYCEALRYYCQQWRWRHWRRKALRLWRCARINSQWRQSRKRLFVTSRPPEWHTCLGSNFLLAPGK